MMLYRRLLTLSLIQLILGACEKIVTRREIRELSDAERTTFFNAVKQLHDNGNDVFSKFASIYSENIEIISKGAAMFSWSRQFLYLFELELQKINSSITLPYWDLSIDYENIEKSIILSDAYFGGDGNMGDACVKNGVFSGWEVPKPTNHCLKRKFDFRKIRGILFSTKQASSLLKSLKSYKDLVRVIIKHYDKNVRAFIGGDLKTNYAPNDPLFYLHFTFIDLLWNEWQLRYPELAFTYNDSTFPDKITFNRRDILKPFNVRANSTFDTANLCYKYKWLGKE